MELTLNGLHATAQYHAENIESVGFNIESTNLGKAGRGVYFWEYVKNKSNAQKLARAWWEFCNGKVNIYDKTQCCKYTEFDVSVVVKESNLLDFIGNTELREAFWELYPNGERDEVSYGACLDVFLADLEQELNVEYQVVKIGLSAPNFRKVAFGNNFPAFVLKKQVDVEINSIIRG